MLNLFQHPIIQVFSLAAIFYFYTVNHFLGVTPIEKLVPASSTLRFAAVFFFAKKEQRKRTGFVPHSLFPLLTKPYSRCLTHVETGFMKFIPNITLFPHYKYPPLEGAGGGFLRYNQILTLTSEQRLFTGLRKNNKNETPK